MIYASVYGASRYGGIAYGVRRAANYSALLSESSAATDIAPLFLTCRPAITENTTGGDALPAIAACIQAITQSLSSNDVVTGAASYITLLSENTIGSDAAGASVNLAILIADSLTSQDTSIAGLSIILNAAEISAVSDGLTPFFTFSERLPIGIISSDGATIYYSHPITILSSDPENRSTTIGIEVRSGQGVSRDPTHVMQEDRTVSTQADPRNSVSRSDSRTFEA